MSKSVKCIYIPEKIDACVYVCAEMMENVCKSGTLRVCEVKSERSKNYCSRYCELSDSTFRLHKDMRVRLCMCKQYDGCVAVEKNEYMNKLKAIKPIH